MGTRKNRGGAVNAVTPSEKPTSTVDVTPKPTTNVTEKKETEVVTPSTSSSPGANAIEQQRNAGANAIEQQRNAGANAASSIEQPQRIAGETVGEDLVAQAAETERLAQEAQAKEEGTPQIDPLTGRVLDIANKILKSGVVTSGGPSGSPSGSPSGGPSGGPGVGPSGGPGGSPSGGPSVGPGVGPGASRASPSQFDPRFITSILSELKTKNVYISPDNTYKITKTGDSITIGPNKP